MPNMGGMSPRAAKRLAKQAGGGAGGAGLPGLPAGADFDMLSQLMGDGDGGGELPSGFPGLPAAGGAPRPVVSSNKGTKKKKKGGRVTPPKGR
jgi:hypothetical protein